MKNLEGISACSNESFAGHINQASGISKTRSANNTSESPAAQAFRAKHDRKNPNLFIPPVEHKRRFHVLEEGKRRFSATYHDPQKYPIGRLFYDDSKRTKRGAYRLRRSEKREGITHRLLQVMLHCLNLNTWQIGKPLVDGFHAYGIEKLAEWAGISPRRAARIMALLEKHGYAEVIQRSVQRPDGSYKGLPAIIKINPKLFYDMDLTDDDILIGRTKQEKAANKEFIMDKIKNFRVNAREARKTHKREMASLRELIAKQRASQSITPEEQTILDREQPGHYRQREVQPLYRDYTGIAKDRSLHTVKSDSPTPVGEILAHLRSFLKPKPPS